METLTIRVLEAADTPVIVAAFRPLGWHGKTVEVFESYLREQSVGQRIGLVATLDGVFAGYITVKWHSEYPPFAEKGIPEIQDLNVLPDFRRRRVASRLVDEAERRIFERGAVAGIGFGISADYGPAQRMYVRRGYVPDGRGLFANGRFVPDNATVFVGECVIYLTKERPGKA